MYCCHHGEEQMSNGHHRERYQKMHNQPITVDDGPRDRATACRTPNRIAVAKQMPPDCQESEQVEVVDDERREQQ
jgi:hypothetical protein